MPKHNTKDDQKKLIKYWNELQLTKKIPKNDDFKFLENENRYKIITILSQGIEDKNIENSQVFIRHALTAHEIRTQIKKLHDYDITEANIHFHIQKLIDKGFIKEVHEIKTGRRPKKYYGRTAKMFLASEEDGDSKIEKIGEDEFIRKLIDLILLINPSIERDAILSRFKVIYESKKLIDYNVIEKWMTKYKDEITKTEIEFRELYLYISKAMTFNEDFVNFYSFILENLKFQTKFE